MTIGQILDVSIKNVSKMAARRDDKNMEYLHGILYDYGWAMNVIYG